MRYQPLTTIPSYVRLTKAPYDTHQGPNIADLYTYGLVLPVIGMVAVNTFTPGVPWIAVLMASSLAVIDAIYETYWRVWRNMRCTFPLMYKVIYITSLIIIAINGTRCAICTLASAGALFLAIRRLYRYPSPQNYTA